MKHSHRKPRRAKQAKGEREMTIRLSESFRRQIETAYAGAACASPPRMQATNRRAPEIALELDRERVLDTGAGC